MKPKVSIVCITYNHGDYIGKAIEGFLMQKTSFPYEILIHDDASTDNTAEIIKSYEVRFPDIIKPIYQIENQYSKGIKISPTYLYPKAAGEYIAICEGDDFWTDENKLQIQVDYMDKNLQCSVCVHNAILINSSADKKIGDVRPSKRDREFSVDEVIKGGGGLFATSSIMFRNIYSSRLPEFYYSCSVGDYPLMIHLSLMGKVFYIDKCLSVYRVGVKDSWTENNSSIEKIENHYNKRNRWLDSLNDYLKGQYYISIEKTKLRNSFNVLIAKENFKEIKTGKYKKIYSKLNKRDKMKIFTKQHFPSFAQVLKKLKKDYVQWKLNITRLRF